MAKKKPIAKSNKAHYPELLYVLAEDYEHGGLLEAFFDLDSLSTADPNETVLVYRLEAIKKLQLSGVELVDV